MSLVSRTLRRGLGSAAAAPSPRLAALRARLALEPRAAGDVAAAPRLPSPPPPSPRAAPTIPGTEHELTDGFGRRHTYLRVSLTERCNLRCTYCMPADGVPLTPQAQLLRTDELLRLCAVLTQLGVTKIRLTGGEPTLRPDVVSVARALARLPGLTTLAMTTNGVLLPRLLPGLLDAGVTRFNVSMDTLRRARLEAISRRSAAHWDRAWEGLAAAVGASPAAVVKLNCVVVRGVNDDELADFVQLTRYWPLEVRFIELMPFAANGWREPQFVGWEEQRDAIAAAFPGFAPEPLPAAGASAETARLWRVPGHAGAVGFVASMTSAFCASCNRLRLTADGALKACLHGAAETDLRGALRRGAGDDEIAALARAALRGKHAALGGHGSRFGLADATGAAGDAGRPMVRIGG